MQIKWCDSKLLLVICSVGVLLSSCALWGPSYVKPNVDTPSSWNSQDKLAHTESSAVNLPATAWWSRFHDDKLDALIESALVNNNNIQQAIGNIIQAQGALEQVQMAWVPTANIAAGYSSTTSGGGAGLTNINAGNVSGTGYSAGLMPSYTLNIMQQLRAQEAAKASLLAARATKDAMRLTVISQVAGSYFTLAEARYQLAIQHELVDDTEELYTLAKSQYTDGYISLLTLQNYRQQYEQAKAQLPITENNIVATSNALRVLLNQNPGDIEMGSKFTEIPMDGIIPANLPSSVLRQRPDVIAAEEQLISANADIGVATATFFPSLSLTGNLGSASTGLTNLFGSGSNFWSDQVAATMPVLSLATFGQIRSARGAYYAAYYNYILTVRNAFASVDNGLAAHQKITDSYVSQKQAYLSTKTAYRLGMNNFEQGLYSKLQELNYKVSMDNAAITLANTKLQQLQSIVNLYQALAGGYNVNNTESANKFGDARDAGGYL